MGRFWWECIGTVSPFVVGFTAGDLVGGAYLLSVRYWSVLIGALIITGIIEGVAKRRLAKIPF